MIYYHTHHFLAQHQYLSPEPPNDFAYWVTTVLQEDRLGEQLAAIDIDPVPQPAACCAIASSTSIETYLEDRRELRTAPQGEELHLREAATFVDADRVGGARPGRVRRLHGAASVSASLALHFFDARLRLERGENDFSEWLRALGEDELAAAIARLDPYTYTMDGLRRESRTPGAAAADGAARMSGMLEQYEPVVGASTLDELRLLARHLEGRRIVTVNSTAVGGGVAEILNRMVPLCGELGVKIRWDVIKGGEDFFAVTKTHPQHAARQARAVHRARPRGLPRHHRAQPRARWISTPTSCSSTIRNRSG